MDGYAVAAAAEEVGDDLCGLEGVNSERRRIRSVGVNCSTKVRSSFGRAFDSLTVGLLAKSPAGYWPVDG
jgi:hypothetical protein